MGVKPSLRLEPNGSFDRRAKRPAPFAANLTEPTYTGRTYTRWTSHKRTSQERT